MFAGQEGDVGSSGMLHRGGVAEMSSCFIPYPVNVLSAVLSSLDLPTGLCTRAVL